ncbi:cytochrome b/b6 domain-containing protein [Azospirillum sp. A1-3]|uniref:cytochrome b n=1 Tax=Azospirillum sp. A1-3 TaxID=185874 RepID=UPI0020778CDC|nr:cytochrome b/b6 domain-containing protein [Azospirillum sp. A1-3]MCM8735765.1 cytochrome b/b6 domain-containing protein [Azospirillum sp. A1-3]
MTGAKMAHGTLYALMFAVPIVGWLMLSTAGHQVELGVVTILALIEKNEASKEILTKVHELLAFRFMGLLTIHVAADLKHHFVDRDRTLVLQPGLSALLAVEGFILPEGG